MYQGCTFQANIILTIPWQHLTNARIIQMKDTRICEILPWLAQIICCAKLGVWHWQLQTNLLEDSANMKGYLHSIFTDDRNLHRRTLILVVICNFRKVGAAYRSDFPPWLNWRACLECTALVFNILMWPICSLRNHIPDTDYSSRKIALRPFCEMSRMVVVRNMSGSPGTIYIYEGTSQPAFDSRKNNCIIKGLYYWIHLKYYIYSDF